MHRLPSPRQTDLASEGWDSDIHKGASAMPLTLMSPAFLDGDPIPRQFTCDGANVPPPLTWSGSPDGTRSFALVVEDPDAPGGKFTHWVLYDIPAQTNQWPSEGNSKTIRNSFGRSGYGGPCPPPDDGPHRYVFAIHAIDVRYLELAGKRVEDFRTALDPHILATGRLVGSYERAK
jgi:Raf kinase inhibitor-like YbhB/YbcL family protein